MLVMKVQKNKEEIRLEKNSVSVKNVFILHLSKQQFITLPLFWVSVSDFSAQF